MIEQSGSAGEPLLQALAEWRASARSAHESLRTRQRRTSLDLLHAARHVQSELDDLTAIEARHRSQEQLARATRAALTAARDNLAGHITMARQLELAATRALDRLGTARDPRAALAASALERANAQLTQLLSAESLINRTLAGLARTAARLERSASQLADTRTTMSRLIVDAETGLGHIAQADRVLDQIGACYEQAQLSVVDTRRELLPDPIGPRFDLPTPQSVIEPAPVTESAPELPDAPFVAAVAEQPEKVLV